MRNSSLGTAVVLFLSVAIFLKEGKICYIWFIFINDIGLNNIYFNIFLHTLCIRHSNKKERHKYTF